jgi:hypothetical protein
MAPGKQYAGWARFSPDRTKVAFEHGGDVDGAWVSHVAVVDLATSEMVVGDTDFSNGGAIEWSPYGTQVILHPNHPDDRPMPHRLLDPETGVVTDAPWTSTSYPTMQRLAP